MKICMDCDATFDEFLYECPCCGSDDVLDYNQYQENQRINRRDDEAADRRLWDDK